jgi:hypothetical protein
MHLVAGLSLKSFVFESEPVWMRFVLAEVPLEQVLSTLYFGLNTFSDVAIASFTSLLPSFSLFFAANRSRLYSEKIKRSIRILYYISQTQQLFVLLCGMSDK